MDPDQASLSRIPGMGSMCAQTRAIKGAAIINNASGAGLSTQFCLGRAFSDGGSEMLATSDFSVRAGGCGLSAVDQVPEYSKSQTEENGDRSVPQAHSASRCASDTCVSPGSFNCFRPCCFANER